MNIFFLLVLFCHIAIHIHWAEKRGNNNNRLDSHENIKLDIGPL